MQTRIRALTNLVRSAKYVVCPRVGLRVFSTEAAPAQDVYEHVSNMKTKDLFQFEPFSNEDVMNFPQVKNGKNYSLNWALANENFTIWGNAYRNPSIDVLERDSHGEVDREGNTTCTRHYLPSSEVAVKSGDFEDISDSVKDFLAQVPNLYVEDAAVCSGRCAELRIRSITNDAVTAMALKNLLHRMPLRDPMTPHPLSVIVARGMPESFTAIGTDPHSKSLTVIATGNTPIDRILAEVAKAAAKQMDAARGTFEVEIPETEPGKGPTKQVKKGPVLQSVVGAAVVQNPAGETVMICGIPEEAKNAALRAGKLFCGGNAVLTKDGVSRVFAGEAVKADAAPVSGSMIVNGEAFVPVAGDNLLAFPSKVVFVEESGKPVQNEEVATKLGAYCCCEDTAKFAAELLQKKGAEFVCVDAASVGSLF